MPSDNTTLTIEEVAHPWYVRHRSWLVAGAIAGGLVALGRLRANNLSPEQNPLRSKDSKYWLEPLSLGDESPTPIGQTPEHLKGLWDFGKDVTVDRVAQRTLSVAVIDSILQLYNALGRPNRLPFSTFRKLATTIHSEDEPDWSANIVNLRWLFEAAQKDSNLLRWVWYAVHVPEIAKLSPEDQTRVFRIIDSLPKKERWRVKWYFSSIPSLQHPVKHLPAMYSINGEDNYHHGHLDIASESGYTLSEAVSLPYKTFLEKIDIKRHRGRKPAKLILWEEVHEFEPKKSELQNLSTRAIVNFPKKDYLRAYQFLKKDKKFIQEADRIRGATGLAFTFGADWKKWLEGMAKKGIDAHDATFWLPQQPSAGFGQFLRRRFLPMDNVGASVINQMNLIASAWNDLPRTVRRDSTKNIVRYITSTTYENVKDEKFAEEAARWGVDEDDYKVLESRYRAGLASGSTIPSIVVEDFGLRLSKLDRDDPRGLFLGHHTACCQAPGMAGEACAWHGVESPNGGFYVVEDNQGQIVAQAWTWRNHDVVVFDNIEGPGIQASATRNKIIQMFHWLSGRMLEADSSILEVRIGTTYDRRRSGTINWGAIDAASQGISIALIPPPIDYIYKCDDLYTDSGEIQYILARSGEGTKYFRSVKYMHELAGVLIAIQHDSESPIYRSEDALDAVSNYIEASLFDVDVWVDDVREEVWNGSYLTVNFSIKVCLEDDESGTGTESVVIPSNVTGYFTDFDLQDFDIESEYLGGCEAEERFAYKMIELSGRSITDREVLEVYMKPPPEVYYAFNAPYLVTVNMDKFKGYSTYQDAREAWSMLEGVNETLYHDDAQIYLLRKLDEDEIEEYEDNGLLKDDCWQLQEDEWWCWEE
jgi:hypothetical protein